MVWRKLQEMGLGLGGYSGSSSYYCMLLVLLLLQDGLAGVVDAGTGTTAVSAVRGCSSRR
jgi:hypothetical protein